MIVLDKQDIRINVFFVGAIIFKIILFSWIIIFIISFFNDNYVVLTKNLLFALGISYLLNLCWGFLTSNKEDTSEKSNIRIDVVDEVLKDKSIGRFNYEYLIGNILKIVPGDHFVGLSKIVIGSSPVGRKATKEAWGTYHGKREGAKVPFVNVYAKSIYEFHPKWFMILCPFVYTMYLAEVVYHEVGHHYQRVGKGYKKEEWGNHAERYSKYMLSEYYSSNFFMNLLRYTWCMLMFKKPKRHGKSFK